MIDSAPATPDPAGPEQARLDTLRHRLAADSLALVSFGEDGLHVLAQSGVRIGGSSAVAVGAACAEAERCPARAATRATTPTAAAHVVPLPGHPGPGTVAVVVVLPRTPQAPSDDEVTAALLGAFTATASRAA